MFVEHIVNAKAVEESVQDEIADILGMGHAGEFILAIKLNNHLPALGLIL